MRVDGERASRLRWLLTGIILVSIGIKVGLLFTSQSLADGDEAVEGLMGIHIMNGLEHPIYPYGVRYGAGAGLEAHLAALSFKVFGISSPALKAVGLLFWSINLVLVGLIGRRLGGSQVALGAIALFGFSPAAAQWSLKVAGGHQVAVTICLVMILLVESGVHPAAIVPLAPLAAFAHPVALSFAGLLAAYLLVRGRDRLVTFTSLLISTLIVGAVLYPRLLKSQEVWNPAATELAPLALVRSLLISLTTFFAPNQNAMTPPGGLGLFVSVLWMQAFLASLAYCRGSRLLLYALSVLGVVFLVDSEFFAARHLIVLQPIASLIMASGAVSLRQRGYAALALMAALGAAVQVNEMRSPFIYGAGREAGGLSRAEVRTVLQSLRERHIEHVYNGEPMLQWVLMFESHEEIIGRGANPNDRVPGYARRVDQAWVQGLPVALVVRSEGELQMVPNPQPAFIEAHFAPAIPLRSSPGATGRQD